MAKKITGKDGPTLGLETSGDMYKKLKVESCRLQKDWLNTYDTFNFLVTAWHLFHDWPKSKDSTPLSKSKRNKNKLPENMQLVLSTMRDLCNGSKHFEFDKKNTSKRVVTNVHTHEIDSYYGYFFHESVPGITVNDFWYFSIRVLHNLTMHYYQWVFDEKTPVKDFPLALEESILYCHIPSRNSSKLSPEASAIVFDDLKY